MIYFNIFIFCKYKNIYFIFFLYNYLKYIQFIKINLPKYGKKNIKIILELKLFGIQLHRPIGMYFFS